MATRKIVLAVDPFTDEPDASAEKVARSVVAFAKQEGTRVEAVYVMTPTGIGLTLEEMPEHQDRYKSLAHGVLDKALARLNDVARVESTVLPIGSSSTVVAVEALLRHVKSQGADLIALSTHARKGMDRLFLGSFAEALLARSPVPLLITNPTAPWDPAFHQVLFATDLAKESDAAFSRTIQMAKDLGSKVTLFHRLDPENASMTSLGFIAVEEWKNRKTERQAKAQDLKQRAEEAGVETTIDIDTHGYRIAPSIIEAATRHSSSLIVIGLQHSPSILSLENVPRQLVRSATCPILVLPLPANRSTVSLASSYFHVATEA